MTTKNIIAYINKGEKLTDTNYEIWHKKMIFLLNVQEFFEHLTTNMTISTDGHTIQHRRDLETFQAWSKKDCSVCFTLLNCMHDKFIGTYKHCHYKKTGLLKRMESVSKGLFFRFKRSIETVLKRKNEISKNWRINSLLKRTNRIKRVPF
ncbi:hypothetical protein CFOL_v3_11725 [Cephalotus follicularis]|uniref:UBN2_3 domain-containing protein n=1 Tax=Cephalotus follicularis TaxID=3775 RepID=A0A1Q3BK53_CEPFO|nr:hypothetical protein CFOL_v3_11725 [Cephalotus follicularis]